jgi:hypothetical protein
MSWWWSCPPPSLWGWGGVCVCGWSLILEFDKQIGHGTYHGVGVVPPPFPCGRRVGLVWLGLESLELNLVI